MNEGVKQRGFTLDSLLGLQDTKAFDRKTSALHYFIKVVGACFRLMARQSAGARLSVGG